MEIASEEVGSTLPIIHGVWADGSLEAARIARQAQAGGASALLVFPPAPFTLASRPRCAGPFPGHRRCDRSATDRVSISSGHRPGLPAATLEKLFDEVPTIRAIKDWTPMVQQYERNQ